MKDIIKKEVIRLLKLGDKFTNKDLLKLKEQYDNDIVDEISRVFYKKYNYIRKNAQKFATIIIDKYVNLPYHLILEKAQKHAKKLDMSDFEFEEFKKILEKELSGINYKKDLIQPMTNIMKALGDISIDIKKLNIDEIDRKNLEEILKLYQESKNLHYYVISQSLTYCKNNRIDLEAVVNNYRKGYHNIYSHIHPLLVAMFLNKNLELENRFIYANLAGIINARYNNESLETKSNYELFYDIINDPNDIVCNNTSTMADILYRCNIQNHLWNNILHLRSGKIYNDSFKDFMTAIDVCTLNKYVNPDFIYGQHDGTILQRLLNAFSYKPTVVSTTDVIESTNIFNPYKQVIQPQITRIPLISIRISDLDTYIIEDLLKETQQFFIIDGKVIKKKVEIIYSRGNIFIHLDRTSKNIKLGHFMVKKYKNSIEQFEKIVTKKCIFRDLDSIYLGQGQGNEYMVSGMVVNTSATYNNIDYSTGSISYIRNKNNDYYRYNPIKGTESAYDAINIDRNYKVNGTINNDNEQNLIQNNLIIYILTSKDMKANLNVREL
jgi:hypothetical protein